MAKIRVHEFAKKLNIKSADVLSALKSTEYEVTNVQSAIGEDAQAYLKAHFAKDNQKADDSAKPVGKPKGDANRIIGVSKAEQAARPRNIISISGAKKPKAEKTSDEREDMSLREQENDADGIRRDGRTRRRRKDQNGANPQGSQESGTNNDKVSDSNKSDLNKKKSGISTLYNAEYSTSTRRSRGRDRDRNARKENARPEQHSIIRPRPVGERAMRPISERTANIEEPEEKPDTTPVISSPERDVHSEEPQNIKNTVTQPVEANPQEESRDTAVSEKEPMQQTDETKPAGNAPEESAPASSGEQGEQILQSGSRILGNIFADGNYTVQDTEKSTSRSSRSRRNRSDKDRRSDNRDGRDGNRGEGKDSRRDNRDNRESSRSEGRDNRDGRSSRDGSRRDGRDNRDASRGDNRSGRDGRANGQAASREGRMDNRDGNRTGRDANRNRNGERRNDRTQGGDYRNDPDRQGPDRRGARQGG
ncbi:MAG: translation initiation factor IF-2 N-terminal domain-containing protein, partial [Clostridiales bacterium]|nr:translation initiation factor IF-2 N-terminal domain-containing protein [Clostridiales bacterium]